MYKRNSVLGMVGVLAAQIALSNAGMLGYQSEESPGEQIPGSIPKWRNRKAARTGKLEKLVNKRRRQNQIAARSRHRNRMNNS